VSPAQQHAEKTPDSPTLNTPFRLRSETDHGATVRKVASVGSTSIRTYGCALSLRRNRSWSVCCFEASTYMIAEGYVFWKVGWMVWLGRFFVTFLAGAFLLDGILALNDVINHQSFTFHLSRYASVRVVHYYNATPHVTYWLLFALGFLVRLACGAVGLRVAFRYWFRVNWKGWVDHS